MILRDDDERLTLNMRHDTSSYSNQPKKNQSTRLMYSMIQGGNVLPKKLLDLDSTKDLHPPHHVSTTSSSSLNHLLEEFVDELALITFPPEYDDDLTFDIESDLKEIEYLLHQDPIKDMDSILEDSIDQSNLADLNDNLANAIPEMLTDEHVFDLGILIQENRFEIITRVAPEKNEKKLAISHASLILEDFD
nr:hypothetical protein [Tanacetum cinerariifolium]